MSELTTEKVIEVLRKMHSEAVDLYHDDELKERQQALEKAINELKRQIPVKPINNEGKTWDCPVCHHHIIGVWARTAVQQIMEEYGLVYCLGCGQKLDWSEEK